MIAIAVHAAALLLTSAASSELELQPGDRICLVGNALAERMQHTGWLETRLQQRFPELGLTFRNLGFSGDEVETRRRTDGFGTPDEWLDRCDASVVFAFFGFCESFAGPDGVADFERALSAYAAHVLAQDYSGEGPPRLVLFSSIPFQDLDEAGLPEGAEHNARIELYNAAIERVATRRGIPYVDLNTPLRRDYELVRGPLTIDGIHLNDAGDRALARAIEAALFGDARTGLDGIEALRREVLARNHLWFNRYRVTDGYNVYGGRSALRFTEEITSGGQDYSKGLSNLDVLQREMDMLDAMTAGADLRIHAAARGMDPATAPIVPVPEEIPVPTNRPGPHTFLGGEEALARMTPAEGMQVRLFASEEQFPEIANPVQMAWDTRGRLWIAAWPTYPHWEPGLPMNDKLVILEDTDGDGRADRSTIFAEDLHNPTGFEFWNGGVFVASCPDLLFLEDTDGDDRADRRERVLHGLSSADTHHAANSFVMGPDGALYFQEGTFHMSQVESIYGVVRNNGGCVWRYEPRTRRVERYIPYGFANPHGHVFDRWGQDFMTDGTGNVNYYALPFSGHLEYPQRHSSYFPFFQQRSRPCGATEILSSGHFPDSHQGNYLVANVIGFQGIFQYELEDDGSGFKANEVEPIVHSSDLNFRPVDIEVGPDGAIYFLDWHNPLIGHMQHHLRDPSRDGDHGRVYRVSWVDGPEVEPLSIAGRTVAELVELLASPDDRLRYRARIELSEHGDKEVVEAARAWGASRADDHDRLEAFWLLARRGVVDEGLLDALIASEDHRTRAAATRVVRQQRRTFKPALGLLGGLVDDEHPRVRLEALVALSHFPEPYAAERALRVLDRPMDRFLDYALEETLRALEPQWREEVLNNRGFATDSAVEYLLPRFSVEELQRIPRDRSVQRELLGRHGLSSAEYADSVRALADQAGESPLDIWREVVRTADLSEKPHADHLLGSLFAAFPELETSGGATTGFLEQLASEGRRVTTRRRALAELISRGQLREPEQQDDGSVLVPSPDYVRDVLLASPWVRGEDVREELFELATEYATWPARNAAPPMSARYIRIELPGNERTLTLAEVEVFSDGVNIAPQGSASQSTVNWGGVAERALDGNRNGRWSAGGQTHTVEDKADPWWELDLGRETTFEEIVVWNRTDGDFGRRLEGLHIKNIDGERRVVWEAGASENLERYSFLTGSDPMNDVRLAAVGAIADLRTREDQAAALLVGALADPLLRQRCVAGLRAIDLASWRAETSEQLGNWLLERFTGKHEQVFLSAQGRELLVLAEELAPHLEADLAQRLLTERRKLGPQVIVIRPIRDAMVYDTTAFSVVAGKPVELVFDNVDIMPHNLLVTEPGALALVGEAGEAMAREADAWERDFVPELDAVLFASRLLQPGERQTLTFEAPTEPGAYPYVCTFPGHWVRMNGVMTVVADWDQLGAPIEAAAEVEAAAPARPFVRNWKLDELRGSLESVGTADPRNGRALLEVASCLRCHAVDGEGGITGPDLRDAVARHESVENLLAHLLEPSLEILEGYESEVFLTTDGRVVAGRVMGAEAGLLLVQDDPYRDDLLELPLDEIEARRASDVSLMPAGLLSTFARGEILDLLAYLESLREGSGG